MFSMCVIALACVFNYTPFAFQPCNLSVGQFRHSPPSPKPRQKNGPNPFCSYLLMLFMPVLTPAVFIMLCFFAHRNPRTSSPTRTVSSRFAVSGHRCCTGGCFRGLLALSRTHTHTHTHLHTLTHTHKRAHTHTHTHTHTQTHTHTHKRAHTHKRTQTHTTSTQNTYTHIHTYTHTHTHTPYTHPLTLCHSPTHLYTQCLTCRFWVGAPR